MTNHDLRKRFGHHTRRQQGATISGMPGTRFFQFRAYPVMQLHERTMPGAGVTIDTNNIF
jgi:hypothetical protein